MHYKRFDINNWRQSLTKLNPLLPKLNKEYTTHNCAILSTQILPQKVKGIYTWRC